VAGGITLRQYFSGAVAPATRLQARAVWELVIFILNGVIFILIGLELGALRDTMPAGQHGPVLFAGLMVSATVILVRFLWVPLAALIPRCLSATLRARDPMPPWKGLFLISWTGMRGIVTLAAALALPMTTGSGATFPFRAEIILISFMVILVTLVLQGLSLPPIIRWLRLQEDDELEGEERLAREHAATAALTRLDQVVTENWVDVVQIERVRLRYLRRLEHLTRTGVHEEDRTDGTVETIQRLHHEVLTAERVALIGLRNDGTISDEVLHQLEQELDVAALHQGVGERRVGNGRR
jgi:CPA1 family monovalent cation:H+ antiporter